MKKGNIKITDVQKHDKSYYSTNIFWRDLPHILERYKQKYNLELNPDFQRGHVWTCQQQIEFIEFIIQGGESGNIIYFNYPDWGSFRKSDLDNDKMVCVDGLQRITAVLAFLNGEFAILNDIYVFDFHPRAFLGVDFIFKIRNLMDYNDVLEWYIFLNAGGTPHKQVEIDRVRAMIKKEK